MQPTGSDAPPGAEATIDVIIAVWNRSSTIDRAILSVVGEESVKSIIVVDDASTDDTVARAMALARIHPKITVVTSDRNHGPSAARNRALALSSSPWVTVLDGDDFMLPGRLAQLLAMAEDWDFVADDLFQLADGAPTDTAARLLNVDEGWLPSVDLATFIAGNIEQKKAHRREMGFLKPLMRRAFLDRCGLRYDNDLRLGEDYILYARALAARGRFRIVPAAGYVAVMRSDSLSVHHAQRDLEALLLADRALGDLPGLDRTERRLIDRHCENLTAKIQWLIVIEAVKHRKAGPVIRAFRISPTVSWSLAGNLLQQARLRSIAKMQRLIGRAG